MNDNEITGLAAAVFLRILDVRNAAAECSLGLLPLLTESISVLNCHCGLNLNLF